MASLQRMATGVLDADLRTALLGPVSSASRFQDTPRGNRLAEELIAWCYGRRSNRGQMAPISGKEVQSTQITCPKGTIMIPCKGPVAGLIELLILVLHASCLGYGESGTEVAATGVPPRSGFQELRRTLSQTPLIVIDL